MFKFFTHLFCSFASASGESLTYTKDIVTSTASASACSNISHDIAFQEANNLAKFVAENVAIIFVIFYSNAKKSIGFENNVIFVKFQVNVNKSIDY